MGNDGVYKGSASDTQAAFARLMQTIKAKKSNIVVNGSNDVFMIKMRKEAIAQGVDSVKIWACGIACYTPNFLEQGGKDVEGTYVYMQNLPFEDQGSNDSLDAFLGAIGGAGKATSWGAAAWAAADEFKQVADDIAATDGPNALDAGEVPREDQDRQQLRRQRLLRPARAAQVLRLHGRDAGAERQVRPRSSPPRRASSTATPTT